MNGARAHAQFCGNPAPGVTRTQNAVNHPVSELEENWIDCGGFAARANIGVRGI